MEDQRHIDTVPVPTRARDDAPQSDIDAHAAATVATRRSEPADGNVAACAGATLGKYQMVRELGRGGMGSVFLARDTRLGRLVAIKFLKVRDPALSARFVAEARTTARCNADAMARVILELADARLLHIESGERDAATAATPDDDDGSMTRILGQVRGSVELVHESLIGSWPTLQAWLRENRQDVHFLARVRSAAHAWQRHERTDDLLWRGQAAAEVERWLQQATTEAREVGPRERDFLDAVAALATRARRRRQLLVVAGLLALGMIAVMLALMFAQADRETLARASEAHGPHRSPGAHRIGGVQPGWHARCHCFAGSDSASVAPGPTRSG